MKCEFNLAQRFQDHSIARPDSLALCVGEVRLSYLELAEKARHIAGWIHSTHGGSPGRIGIIASRTAEAYAAVLGALWAGAAYVPINAHIPPDRLICILKTAGVTALIADREGANLLTNSALKVAPTNILLGPGSNVPCASSKVPKILFENMAGLPNLGPDQPVPIVQDALAYILFTSGTTGTPKGVMIEAGSFTRLMSAVRERYDFCPDDRVALTTELTFDASIFTIFLAWNAGASLYVVPSEQLLAPGRFFVEHQITSTVLVPSVGEFMQRLGMLKPGTYPRLRYSFFGGEGLSLGLVKAWQTAAPSCWIENQYGPTEATVLCLWQRVTDPPQTTPARCTLAIGRPIECMEAEVVDDALNAVAPCQPGELIVSGSLLARGYLNDPVMTSARFPVLRGRRWYRTGDLVYRDESGTFHHLGRIDNQVKVLGNRVELEEVEAHLRTVIGNDMVAAVAWPLVNNNASSIIAFHCRSNISRDEVRLAMKKYVPDYMNPQRVYCMNALPLGSTGKIDRKALVTLLDNKML